LFFLEKADDVGEEAVVAHIAADDEARLERAVGQLHLDVDHAGNDMTAVAEIALAEAVGERIEGRIGTFHHDPARLDLFVVELADGRQQTEHLIAVLDGRILVGLSAPVFGGEDDVVATADELEHLGPLSLDELQLIAMLYLVVCKRDERVVRLVFQAGYLALGDARERTGHDDGVVGRIDARRLVERFVADELLRDSVDHAGAELVEDLLPCRLRLEQALQDELRIVELGAIEDHAADLGGPLSYALGNGSGRHGAERIDRDETYMMARTDAAVLIEEPERETGMVVLQTGERCVFRLVDGQDRIALTDILMAVDRDATLLHVGRHEHVEREGTEAVDDAHILRFVVGAETGVDLADHADRLHTFALELLEGGTDGAVHEQRSIGIEPAAGRSDEETALLEDGLLRGEQELQQLGCGHLLVDHQGRQTAAVEDIAHGIVFDHYGDMRAEQFPADLHVFVHLLAVGGRHVVGLIEIALEDGIVDGAERIGAEEAVYARTQPAVPRTQPKSQQQVDYPQQHQTGQREDNHGMRNLEHPLYDSGDSDAYRPEGIDVFQIAELHKRRCMCDGWYQMSGSPIPPPVPTFAVCKGTEKKSYKQ